MPKHPYPLFRQILRALRKKRGLTQEQLAEKAGADYKYYQLIEIGKTGVPDLEHLSKISAVLGTKAWVLICDDWAVVETATGLTRAKIEEAGATGKGRPPKKS